jgi:hypothetical protein
MTDGDCHLTVNDRHSLVRLVIMESQKRIGCPYTFWYVLSFQTNFEWKKNHIAEKQYILYMSALGDN